MQRDLWDRKNMIENTDSRDVWALWLHFFCVGYSFVCLHGTVRPASLLFLLVVPFRPHNRYGNTKIGPSTKIAFRCFCHYGTQYFISVPVNFCARDKTA